jgi:hypothetical protein
MKTFGFVASVFLYFASVIAMAEEKKKLEFSGYLQSDIRFIVEDYRGEKPGDGYRFELNRNDIKARLKWTPHDKAQGVVDARFRFYGFNESERLQDLSRNTKIEPYDFQLNEAYLAVRRVPFQWMDFRIGRIIQSWGTADMFNPTDNLNSRDFSDPLDYTAKVPNQMVELAFYPASFLQIQVVWVPFFKPSLLPPSAQLGFAVEKTQDNCFLRAPTPPLDRDQIQMLQGLFASIPPCDLNFISADVRTLKPSQSLRNSQVGTRAKFTVGLGDFGDMDFSLSYYYGRFSFPVAYTAVADIKTTSGRTMDVAYIAEVMYPRMQVAGFDFSLSPQSKYVPGFFGEVAVIFPEKVVFGLAVLQNGRLLENLFMSATNVPSTPFVKATAGLDYTIGRKLYLNFQYVRGFFDEFNDRYGIHNYFVPAAETKFFEDELKIRLAGAWNLDDLSAVVFPEITWVAVPSVELVLGSFLYLGDTKPLDPMSYGGRSKFGQKAAGRSVAYLKAKYSW